jgi:hypothetical protein
MQLPSLFCIIAPDPCPPRPPPPPPRANASPANDMAQIATIAATANFLLFMVIPPFLASTKSSTITVPNKNKLASNLNYWICFMLSARMRHEMVQKMHSM